MFISHVTSRGSSLSRYVDRQYLASLQINTDKLLPQFDTIPDVLVEKCAAISVRPDTMKDLTTAMNGG